MSFTLKLLLSPLLVAQALVTRRRATLLPEAAGAREGRIGAGGGAPLRLLIVGDSSAAGVGVAHQDQALAGHLARALQRRVRRPLQWSLRARTGLLTRRLHDLLQEQPPPPADVAVVVTGVNDVIERIAPQRAVAHRAALADWLLERGCARHVVFAPLPPMGQFPLLPQPLRHIIGGDARRHDAALERWLARRTPARRDVSRARIAIELSADTMAADGFHPGEPVYRICGEALAEHIAALVLSPLFNAEGSSELLTVRRPTPETAP